MLINLFLFILSLTNFSHAGIHSGASEAEFKADGEMTVKNTQFIFDRYLLEDQAKPQNIVRLYEVKTLSVSSVAVEPQDPKQTITAFDAKEDKKLWTIVDIAGEFRPLGSLFTARTTAGGDCQNSHRLYSSETGKKLLAYSFADRSTLMPILLRAGAFSPKRFRFLGYQDNYWPCRDRIKLKSPEKGLELAGVITYTSPAKTIQKIAVFYVNNDPSNDPDSISMEYKGKQIKFMGRKGDSPHEYDYWWREKSPQLDPIQLGDKIFSDLSVTLEWNGDMVTIPIENDRLLVSKAKTGKRYKKLLEIPSSDWDKY